MADLETDPKNAYRSIWLSLMQVPFKQDYLQIGDVKVRYVEAGDPAKPTVIMLHGTGGHWEAFCANIGPFSEYFHVLAFDMVGAGFSDKPDQPYVVTNLAAYVLAFMDKLGIDRAHLVGVSLGAHTVARFAIDYPDRTNRIVLISPVGLVRTSPKPDDDTEANVRRRAQIVRNTGWESTKSIFSGIIHDPRDVLDDFVAMRQVMHRLPEAEHNMANVFRMTDPENYAKGALRDDELAGLKAPALVFVSEHDAPMFQTTANVIAQLVPDARLIPLNGVAHWAQFETTEYFNEKAIAFLRD